MCAAESRSDALHKPEHGGADGPFGNSGGFARQMEMRRAVARAHAAAVAAESNGFALGVAAIGVAAITGFEFDQREMARQDFGAAEGRCFRALENWHRPHE